MKRESQSDLWTLKARIDGAMPWRRRHAPDRAAGEQWPELDAATPELPSFALQSLLVPLDGSLLAEHALPRALAIARRSGALVVLAHAHSLLESVDDAWQVYHESDLGARLKRERERYLRSVMQRIHRVDSTPVTTMLMETRDLAGALCQAAGGVDLVVMAAHGRGRLGRWWHGSMTDALMRRLPCPLLLARGYESPVELTGDPIAQRIVIPLDGSAFAEQILAPAAALGRLNGADVTLVRFQGKGESPDDAKAPMQRAIDRSESRLPHVRGHVVSSDRRVASAALSFAEQREADLIALATHWRSGLSRLARGSVADEIVRRSKTPVLLFRPADQEG